MARSRRNQPSPTTPDAGATGAGLVCPECGKTFARPAALGAHRRRAHGVAGASARTRSRSGRPVGGTRRRRTAGTTSRTAAPRRAAGLDRDALLQTVFPGGLPAREEVIRAANAWLDEAERLAAIA